MVNNPTSPVPKWVWKRYAIMWKKFKDKPFSYQDAEKVLKHDKKSAISITFMELRKAGWIDVELSQDDARMRVYTLTNPALVVEGTENDFEKN